MNKINWKLRLQNKTTLITLAVAVITFIYTILAALGITPSVAQEQATNWVYTIISLLCAFGIVVDPTTQGISDSQQAMNYDCPKSDEESKEGK